MTEKTRIVFFVRSFNDIDHIAPLIHYCSLQKSIRTAVFCLEWHYDVFSNPNIIFLLNAKACTVDYLWSPRDGGSKDSMLVRIIDLTRNLTNVVKSYGSSGRNIGHRVATWFSPRLTRLIGVLYDRLSVAQIFKNGPPDALVFDWINAGAFRNRKIVKYAQRYKVPTFCLPHGLIIYSNLYVTRKRRIVVSSRDLYFDHYLAPGLHRAHLEARGIPASKITEIGSMRFCPEWLKVREENRIGYGVGAKRLERSNKLKVVVFLHQLTYNVDSQKLSEFLGSVGRVEGVEVFIKPHTRGMDEQSIRKAIGNKNSVRLATNLDSGRLIDWCDVAVSFGSSIVIEALVKRKIFIYPDYVDSNNIHFADRGGCWLVSSSEELETALKSLSEDISAVPYSRPQEQKLLNEFIFAGATGTDIRRSYLSAILNA